MKRLKRPDAIDTRWVFMAYAASAWMIGFVVFGWVDLFLGPDLGLGGIYLGRSALARIFAAILMGSGCFAAAFIPVEDPVARRRGLFWLAGAHGIIAFALFTQVAGPWGPGLGERMLQIELVVAFLLFYLATTSVGVGTSLIRPWVRNSAEALKFQYAEQIRQAAGQEERHRLARDLHDSIKQQIFVIQTAAATAQARFDNDPEGARQAVEQVRAAARESMTEMEAMLDQLRAAPLENMGLLAALQKQCEALGFRTGAHVEFKLDNLPPSEALEPGAHQAILRVAQEALSNIARHARAQNVTVSLGIEAGRIVLKIQDDGAGFDPESSARGMGIASMQTRAEEFGGQFEQSSRPGQGTFVRFTVPYEFAPAKAYLPGVWVEGAAVLIAILGVLAGDRTMVLAPIGTACLIGVVRRLIAYRRLQKREAAA